MELRSGRRTRRLRHPAEVGDGVDHISGIPDDVLLQLLVRLRCALAAARTGVLSRRWRGLWTRVPGLYFRCVAPHALEATLAQVALPKLSLLHIDNSYRRQPRHAISAAGVASLLRAASRLDPVVFSLIAYVHENDRHVAVEVPSFARATSISLDVDNLRLAPPAPGAGFPVLEMLSVARCHFDAGALISRCPCLRVLEMRCWRGFNSITVHSRSIEELLVIKSPITDVSIDAPMLKKFNLSGCLRGNFTMSLLAPMLDDRSWSCYFTPPSEDVGIHGIWCLHQLIIRTEESSCVLRLYIRPAFSVHFARNLQEMFPLPNFSDLELYLPTHGHVYGAMVLNLLMNCNAIQKLHKLVIEGDEGTYEACPPNCDCDQMQNWRSQNISLGGPEN